MKNKYSIVTRIVYFHLYVFFRESGSSAIHSSSWYPGRRSSHSHARGLRHPPCPQVCPLILSLSYTVCVEALKVFINIEIGPTFVLLY
jgi:hypothetical protein